MPWNGQALKRRQTMGNVINDGGNNVPRPFDLPEVGYLQSLHLSQEVKGQFSVAPTGVDAFATVGGGLSRVTLFVNSIGNLHDTDGFMLSVITALDRQYKSGNGKVNSQASFSATPGTAAFDNKWYYTIPLGLQLKNTPWPIGLFQTALQNLSLRVIPRFLPVQGVAGNPGTGLYTGGTVSAQASGQFQINEGYFDPISDPASQPYLGFIHRWTQWSVPLSASGDLQIQLPGQNYYVRLIFAIVTGAANALALDSTHLDRLRLMYGANLAPYDFDQTKNEVTDYMADLYGDQFVTSLPNGTYVLDFLTETHDNQNWINAAATTNLRAVLTMDPAGTYTGGGYVNIAAEEIAPLALPAAAQVQGGSSVPGSM